MSDDEEGDVKIASLSLDSILDLMEAEVEGLEGDLAAVTLHASIGVLRQAKEEAEKGNVFLAGYKCGVGIQAMEGVGHLHKCKMLGMGFAAHLFPLREVPDGG